MRPVAYWLFAGLVLLAIGGEIWFSEQRHQAEVLQIQQRREAAANAAEGQRETQLLNDYTRQVSSMIPQNLPQNLLSVKLPNSTRVKATMLTRNTLLQLNCEHKATLLRYLFTKKLIDDDFLVVNLQGADFHACNLSGIDLTDTNLSGANFSHADMHKVNLNSTTLVAVNFNGANLADADLRATDMRNADISEANLAGADLAGVVGKNTEQLLPAHSLAGARLPDGSVQPGEVQDTD